jgi:hypothetical protein
MDDRTKDYLWTNSVKECEYVTNVIKNNKKIKNNFSTFIIYF